MNNECMQCPFTGMMLCQDCPYFEMDQNMKKKSNNQLSKEHLEKMGYFVDIVERQIPHSFVKHDLFNVFDLIAIGHGETIGIQVTSTANVAARVKKIEDSIYLSELRKSNWGIWVIGWKKNKEGEWVCKTIDLSQF